jgi:Flp pilus assembly protein TadB
MSQKQVGTRLPGDDAETLEQYCNEKDVSKSEALRRAVRRLDDDKDQSSKTDRSTWLWRLSIVAGLVLVSVSETGIVPEILVLITGPILLVFLGISFYI